jgi:hypothetical protein
MTPEAQTPSAQKEIQAQIAVTLFVLAVLSTLLFAHASLTSIMEPGDHTRDRALIMLLLAATTTISSMGWSIFLIGKQKSLGWAGFGATCPFFLLVGICAAPVIGKYFFHI